MMTVRTSPLLFLWGILSLLAVGTQAVDVKIKSWSCDQDLAVYATSFSMSCDDSDRCTLGSTANFFGSVHYRNAYVEDDDGLIYLSGDMSFVTLDFDLFNFMEAYLCYDGVITAESDQYECPADGDYTFDVSYTLPEAPEGTGWLATGWAARGGLTMYADKSDNSLMGNCTFELEALPTPQSSSGSRLFNTPTAKTASILSIVGLAALLVACAYCMCCGCCPKRRQEKTKDIYGDKDPVEFHRMQDDAATIPTTVSARNDGTMA